MVRPGRSTASAAASVVPGPAPLPVAVTPRRACGESRHFGAHEAQMLWMTARMFPSESLNQAALAPPPVAIPSFIPGMSS